MRLHKNGADSPEQEDLHPDDVLDTMSGKCPSRVKMLVRTA